MKKTFDYKWFWSSIIGFLFPSIIGFVIYALPKYLIKKYLFKKNINDYEIAKDVAISGFIIGMLSLLGKSNQLSYIYPEISQEALIPLTIFTYFGVYLILLILQLIFRLFSYLFKRFVLNNKYNINTNFKDKIKTFLSFLRKSYLYILIPFIFIIFTYFIAYKYFYLGNKQKELLDYKIKCSQASNLLVERVKQEQEDTKIENIKTYFNNTNKKCYLYFETTKYNDSNSIGYKIFGDYTKQKSIYDSFENKYIGGFSSYIWVDEDKIRENGFFNSDTRINFYSEKEFDNYIDNLFKDN